MVVQTAGGHQQDNTECGAASVHPDGCEQMYSRSSRRTEQCRIQIGATMSDITWRARWMFFLFNYSPRYLYLVNRNCSPRYLYLVNLLFNRSAHPAKPSQEPWEIDKRRSKRDIEIGNGKWEIGKGRWNTYRTSPEHPTNIDRKRMEHPLKIIRRYIEGRKGSEHPRDNYMKIYENLWKIYENLSNIYENIRNLFENLRKSIEIYENP